MIVVHHVTYPNYAVIVSSTTLAELGPDNAGGHTLPPLPLPASLFHPSPSLLPLPLSHPPVPCSSLLYPSPLVNVNVSHKC